MIAPSRTGWQTLVADLSIILFMVTAGALAREAPATAHRAPPAAFAATPPTPVAARPLAFYIASPGGPDLSQWLAGQSIDPREQLTIVLRYRRGEQASVSPRIAALFQATARSGIRTRITVEPGDGPMTAGLAFDVSS